MTVEIFHDQSQLKYGARPGSNWFGIEEGI